MYRFLGRSVLIAALVTFTGVAVFAQNKSLACRDDGNGTTTGWLAIVKSESKRLD